MELTRSLTLAPLPAKLTAACCRRRRGLPFGALFSPRRFSSGLEEAMHIRALRPRQEWVGDWVRSNDTFVRSLPILVGGASLLAALLNRTVSGIAAVADASSSQSRADILTLSLSVTDILAGLVWLSIRPKSISPVVPRGVECKRVGTGVSSSALRELLWTWDSLTTATCCKSLVVVYGGNCVLQIGVAAGSAEDGNAVTVDEQKFMQGYLYRNASESKKRECLLLLGKNIFYFQKLHCDFLAEAYLANLALYPGRSELPFLPANTQVQTPFILAKLVTCKQTFV
ncbi:hypothetical protein GUJ93_ZPchr0004g38561 [Zizania palustris]|uniref:Protein COFACTOR ASSEMBLY OF COMPLEX C SUBUNIT B CCB4, chloroplastic n=1 Tax=Zizania palustris TaxID=103762 RepID=A0A8J5SE27_ZIZPA|nr:hypothetical protein GUJ93_ZPchr0004g38561 [Zizania palustris]